MIRIDRIRELLSKQGYRVVTDQEWFDRGTVYATDENACYWMEQCDIAKKRIAALEQAINSPSTEDFDKSVPLEAAHQQERWGSSHDAGKNPSDWFWLIGYLGGKALHAAEQGNLQKALHHCISTAAALRNWHRHLQGSGSMRPGAIIPE